MQGLASDFVYGSRFRSGVMLLGDHVDFLVAGAEKNILRRQEATSTANVIAAVDDWPR